MIPKLKLGKSRAVPQGENRKPYGGGWWWLGGAKTEDAGVSGVRHRRCKNTAKRERRRNSGGQAEGVQPEEERREKQRKIGIHTSSKKGKSGRTEKGGSGSKWKIKNN